MRKSTPPDPSASVGAVPDSGWSMVADLLGPLPELHRGRFVDTGSNRRFVTECGIAGRHVLDLPIGTGARLCTQCFLKNGAKR